MTYLTNSDTKYQSDLSGKISLLNFLIACTVLYLYIFQPEIISKIGYVLISSALSLLVFIKYRLPYIKKLKYEYLFIFFIVLFPFFRDIASSEIVYSDRFLYFSIQTFVFGYFLSVWAIKNKFPMLSYLNLVSVFAAIISILAFFFPSIDLLIKSISSSEIYEQYASFDKRYRGYGLSESLTFSYSIVLCFFAGLNLILSAKKPLNIIFVPVLLFAAMLNARIGFVVFIYMFFYFLITQASSIKNSFKVLGVLFFVILIFYISITLVDGGLNSWYFGALNELLNLFSGVESSTINTLFGDFIVFPDGWTELLFGSGKSLFGIGRGGSDVGFILQINYIGLIYTLFLYLFIFYCFSRLVKIYGLGFWFSSAFLISFLLMNTKGFFFAGLPGPRLVLVLYIYIILKNEHRKHEYI